MKKEPNTVFIVTNDQGAWVVGSGTDRDIRTPNLKCLVESGVTFDEFCCISPVCLPVGAGTVTGRIPSYHGIRDWLRKRNLDAWKCPHMAMMDGFDMEDKSIDYLRGHKIYMEYLAENGYHRALGGKWHMGDNITKKRGFEYYFTIGRGGCHYYDVDMLEDGESSISYEYITDTIINHALEYLGRLSGEGAPSYLSVHYIASHSPQDISEHPRKSRDLYKSYEFKDTQALPIYPWQTNNTCPIDDIPEKRKEYLTGYHAVISVMDADVGKIMNRVAAHRLEEDTVLIFTSGDGVSLGQHRIQEKGNGIYPPSMYDSSAKVPSIIKVPEYGASGSTCSAMARQYGIFPTILSLAGCKYELEPLRPGKSLLEQTNHPAEKYESQIVVFDEYSRTCMMKEGGLKYTHRYGDSPCESYDPPKDPGEETNLFGGPEFEEQIRNLKIELEGQFDRYSVPKMDTRVCDAVDRGQERMCYGENASDQSIELYHRPQGPIFCY